MNNETLQRFLKGTASETEQRTCEALLSGNSPIVDDTLIDNDDPIIAALQQPKDSYSGSIGSSECEVPRGIAQMFPDISERTKQIREVLETPSHPEDLGAIGRYRIVELIGVGSSSWVFRAIDTSMDREVCIKLLQPDKGTSLEVRSRFAREAREVARMCSDRIMPVLELGHLSQTPYLVMPLLEGRSLRTLIEQEQRLTPERAQRFVKQIAEGLSHAHSLGVMHRDIKPENIWVTPSDDIKLLDFGLAHVRDESTPITREGTVVGTPSYMSPEQVTGKPIDARSDLFSLGVVLVELLTGQSPFNKNNLFSTLMSVAGDPIDFAAIDPEHSISQPLRQLIVDLLHKTPDARIRSAELLIERLENLNSQSPFNRPQAIGGGRIFKTIAAGLGGFALCAALLWLWDFSDKGTLLVETSDPAVQVAIANEKVTVVDPVSKQSYEIKIGETKLPSGYYQLEAKLADGLAFSSDSITIRRGEKILVSVSLKPPVDTAKAGGNPAIDPMAHQADSKVAMESDSSLNKPWADPTRDPLAHDPATRQQVFDRVAALPSLTFKRSVQDSQPQISGIQDWWVDTPAGMLSVDSIPNCDQTLWLESQAGWVKVANRSGDKQLHIPTADVVFKGRSMANWDTVNPNLLVITSGSTVYSDTAESQKHPFLAQVWLLSELEDCIQGRLIREYPCDSTNVMLDSGYRIVLVRDRSLEIRRLDSDQVWAVATNQSTPDPFVELFSFGPNAISPEGRWLAATTSTPTQKSIFDLQSGSMWLAVNSGQVLIGNRARALVLNESFKLWDIARQTLEKEIPLDSKIAHSADIAVNPSATYAAYPTDSSVRIIDLKNSKQIIWSPAWNCTVAGHLAKSRNTYSSRQSSLMGSSLRLAWRDDGNLLAFHRGETATWNVDAEDNKATQVVIPDHNPLIGRMEIVGLQLHDDGELSIAWQAANGYQDRVSTARLSLQQLKIQKAMNLDGAYCFDILQKTRHSPQGQAISPDGRYLVVGAHPQAPETANRRSSKFLVEFAQPDAVIAEFLDTNSPERFSWSNDSKYLWAGNEIVDIEQRKNFVMKSDFSRAVPLGKHSVISVQHGEMLFHHSLEIRAGEIIGNQLERTIGYRPSQVALASTSPPLLFLKNSNDKTIGSEITLVRVREDLTFEEVGTGPFSPLDLISPNASHLLRASYPSNPGASNAMVTWQIHRIHAKDERRLEIEKVLDDLTRVEAFQWHPQNVSACWTNRDDKYLRFFDCATNTMHIRRLRSDLVIPFFSGWLIATEDRLIAVDKVGMPNAEILFSWKNGQPKSAHRLLPAGAVQSGVPLQGLFISSVEDNAVRTRPLDQVIESEPFKKVLSDQPMNFLK